MPKHPFQAFELALELIRGLPPVLARIRQRDKRLADQLENAANSVGLNLCEGRRRIGRDKLHFWRMAGSSAEEVRGGLHLAEAWGHLEAADIVASLATLDRILAITWTLTH